MFEIVRTDREEDDDEELATSVCKKLHFGVGGEQAIE